MQQNRSKVMLVDDNMINLTIGREILSTKFEVFTLSSGELLLQVLKQTTPDLILLDIEMPGMNGYDVIKILKENPETKDIPVIFLTSNNQPGDELIGLKLGAMDYITKPFSPDLLLTRIEMHLLVVSQKLALLEYNNNLRELVRRKTKKVVELQNAIVSTVAELVECRDDITGGHIERTKLYIELLIHALRKQGVYAELIEGWDFDFVIQSAQLHDVGKISVKDSILQKPGKLTDEEFEEMKNHTVFGEHVIDKIMKNTSESEFLIHAKIFAGTHHEKWNGTGYPKGLSGDAIPLQGRLMAIADVYDALISKRTYKAAFTHEKAVEIIREGKGIHFDPVLVDVFLSIEDDFRRAAESLQG